jgi:integrase
MAWVKKRPSGRWTARYRLPNGKTRTLGTYDHKREALRRAQEAEAKARKPGALDPRAGEITWADWCTTWWPTRLLDPSTAESEESMRDSRLLPRWGDIPLTQIHRPDIQAWAIDLMKDHGKEHDDGTITHDQEHPRALTAASVRRILNVFVSSLTAAVDAGILEANPALRIKLPPHQAKERVFLTRPQFANLVRQMSPADAAIANFLVGTGCRWGEMAGLHRNRIHDTYIDVIETISAGQIKPWPKGKKRRVVPLPQWVKHRLPEPSNIDGCGLPHTDHTICHDQLVFTTPKGTPLDDRNWTRRTLTPALRKAGLDHLGFTVHDFRHTFASWLLADKVPLERIQQLLGHASIKTTEIYAHLRTPNLQDVEQALPDPNRTPATKQHRLRLIQ